MKHNHSQPGFVILFTILISAIILLIGFGIFSIASRETVLSGTAREAQIAFYAADAGVECALYAQSMGAAGPFATGGGSFPCGADGSVLMSPGSGAQPYEFYLLVDENAKTCAHVSIFDINAGAARRIVSQGYNICDPDTATPITTNPILVERVLDTVYSLTADGTLGGATVTPSGIGIDLFDPSSIPPLSSQGGAGGPSTSLKDSGLPGGQ